MVAGVSLTPGTVALVALLVGGVFFTLTAAVGIFRLPDGYTRSHAAVAFGPSETLKVGLLALFVLVTAPTAAHAVARAAADAGFEPWVRPSEQVLADGGDGDTDGSEVFR